MNMFAKFLVPATMLVLAGCSSSSGPAEAPTFPTPAPTGTASVQVLHASPDAPTVNIIGVLPSPISNVDYKTGTGIVSLTSGTYAISVDGNLPNDETVTVIGPVALDLEADTRYSILAVGDVANISALVLEQPDTAVPAGNARLRVAHGAPMAGEVDVYLTATGADLATGYVGTFEFGGDLGPVDVPAGDDYQIRVTVAGDPDAVAFDSGTIALADGANLLVTAVENTLTGLAPVSLVIQDGAGSAELLDVGTPADLRVVHASSDAGTVDVVANGAELVPDLSFPEFTPFVSVDAGDYVVTVRDSLTMGAAFEELFFDGALEAGVKYDVLAVNTDASLPGPLLAADDSRRVVTESKVRIIHAASAAMDVDVYVTGPDTDLTTVDPTLADVPFEANTGYLSLTPGDYEVTVTAAGSKDAAIGPLAISIEGGGVYTAIARDPLPESSDLGVILIDDFAAE